MMDGVECSKQERYRAIRASLRNVSGDLATKKRRALERAHRSDVSSHTLTVRAARIVWIMFSLVADPRGAVLHFLRSSETGRRFAGVSDDSLLEMAERSFLDADLEKVVELRANKEKFIAKNMDK